MKLLRILTISAAGVVLLGAADVPKKTLTPDFAKAGIKALIAVKNGIKPRGSLLDLTRVQSALDDAEAAAATENDKAVLQLIDRYRLRQLSAATDFDTRVTKAETKYIAAGDDPLRHLVDIVLSVSQDPETQKDVKSSNACSDAIEKVLRSGTLTPVPECEDTPAAPAAK